MPATSWSTRTTLRLGDTIATGGALAPPVRMAGIQYATNFGTDPAFVTFPLPTIGGLARQDSVVDVFIDNVQREARSVPPGPFALESLPVVTGAGEVQLRVTDLLGREQLITQSYYVSSRLLKPGLHDFGYELGALRRDYGRESFDYGDGLASRHPSLRLHRPAHRRGARRGCSSTSRRWPWAAPISWASGAWSAAASAPATATGGPGVLGQLAYEYDGRRFSFGARTRYTTDGYREAGGDEEAARIDQLNLGLDFGRQGQGRPRSCSIASGRDTEDATTVAATYSLAIGPGSLTLRAAQLFRPDDELALTAIYTIPLGTRRSASVELLKRSGDYGTRGTFRQTRGASDLGSGLPARRRGRHARTAASRPAWAIRRPWVPPTWRWSGSTATTPCAPASTAASPWSTARWRSRAASTVRSAWSACPASPTSGSISTTARSGRTDADGRLLLPGLRPYEGNRVRLEVDDLPLDAEITTAEVEAVPFDRSGMTIAFPLARMDQATAILVDADGAALPVGLRLRSADGAVTAWVARDGFTQLKGLGTSAVAVVAEAGGEAIHLHAAAGAGGRAAPRPGPGDMPLIRCLWPAALMRPGAGRTGAVAVQRRAVACHLRRRRHHAAQPGDRRGRAPLRRVRRLRGRHRCWQRRGRHAADGRAQRQPSRLSAVLRRRPVGPLG